jgi:hypothetical protein
MQSFLISSCVHHERGLDHRLDEFTSDRKMNLTFAHQLIDRDEDVDLKGLCSNSPTFLNHTHIPLIPIPIPTHDLSSTPDPLTFPNYQPNNL